MTITKKVIKARRRLSHLPNETDPPMKIWIQPQFNTSNTSRNLNCEICLRLASFSSDVLHCVYCNVVCHITCLQQFYSKVKMSKKWVCFLCIDELDHSRQYYENDKLAVWEHELRIQAQITISKYWRRYKCRKFYLRIYTIIVQIQVMFNIKRRKRAFLFNTQAKLRPMKLHINYCHNLTILDREATKANQQMQHLLAVQQGAHGTTSTSSNANHTWNDDNMSQTSTSSQVSKTVKNSPTKPKKREYEIYVLVTIIDQSRGETAQTWRLITCQRKLMLKPNSSFDVNLDEYIMLGGVSGFNILVLTVFQKGFGRDILLGQVGIDLSENHLWRKGGKFDLKLNKQDYEIKDNIGMDMKIDRRADITGEISFELTSYRGMSSECGYCQASNAEDIIRTLLRMNDVPGYDHGQRGYGSLMKPHANASRVKTFGMSMASNNLLATMNTSQTHATAMKKTWIAIAEGYIFVYSHFGDQLKLTLDLTYFCYTFEFKGKSVIYHLIKPGFPTFSFYPIELSENLRWKCAFLSSSHFVKAQLQHQQQHGHHGSGHHHPKKDQQMLQGHDRQELDGLEAERNLLNLPDGKPGGNTVESGRTSTRSDFSKFDVDSLIADLLVMEAMRPKYKAVTSRMSFIESSRVDNGDNGLKSAGQGDKPFSSNSTSRTSRTNTANPKSPTNRRGSHGNDNSSTLQSKSTSSLPPIPPGTANSVGSNAAADSHNNKSLLNYKPKTKADFGQSLRVEIPALPQALSGANPSSMRSKVLTNVMKSAAPEGGVPVLAMEKVRENVKDDDEVTVGEETLKDQVVEALDMEDAVVNEKYQEYGEQFVSSLMTKVAEHNIRPLHNHGNGTPKHGAPTPKHKSQ